MSSPILVHSHASGPNPWKVAIVLRELGVDYTMKDWYFADMKKEPYESLNPNGRVPAIEDPNFEDSATGQKGITIWESGAIVQYIIEKYDTKNLLSYGKSESEAYKHHLNQWLQFQVSGQGPYFGQWVWFSRYHKPETPSAVERYANEIRRIFGVLDRHLAKNGNNCLVGDKVTYADLSFIPWNAHMHTMLPDWHLEKDFPNYSKWHNSLMARPAVAQVLAERQAAIAKMDHI